MDVRQKKCVAGEFWLRLMDLRVLVEKRQVPSKEPFCKTTEIKIPCTIKLTNLVVSSPRNFILITCVTSGQRIMWLSPARPRERVHFQVILRYFHCLCSNGCELDLSGKLNLSIHLNCPDDSFELF